MGKDLTFNEKSVAVWLRSPKIWTNDNGIIVEVWQVDERPDLDPVQALKTFIQHRSLVFGSAEELPVFLLENGSIYTHSNLNQDLSQLLSLYPELVNSRDTFLGHSFRSGISTLLSVLGHSKEDIQSWGRWASDSYKCYLKDWRARRNVHLKLTNTFKTMLNTL